MRVSRHMDFRALSRLDQSQTFLRLCMVISVFIGVKLSWQKHGCAASPMFCGAWLLEPSQQILFSENVPHPLQGKAC